MAIDGNLRGVLSAQGNLSGRASLASWVSEAELEEKLEEAFAEYSENGTVANAEELVSSRKVNNKIPYLFRATPRAGDRAYFNAVVGASAVMNQAINMTASSWSAVAGSLSNTDAILNYTLTSVSGTTAGNRIQTNATFLSAHKYLVLFDILSPHTPGGAMYFYFGSSAVSKNFGKPTANTWMTVATIVTPNADATYFRMAFSCGTGGGFAVNDVIKLRNAKIVDLTAFFGSATVADYINTLETATAGSGIAKLKEWGFDFSNLDYTQNALKSIEGLESHKTVGRNLYNPTSGIAHLKGGLTYKIEGTYTSLSYTDTSGTTSAITPSSGIFTVDNDGQLTVSGGNATDTIVYIHWDSSNDGVYEPYWERTYPLDDALTLRGIYKIDSNNNLYADGDEYKPSGEVKRRYGIVDLGSLTWTKDGTPFGDNYSVFYASVPNAKGKTSTYGITQICDKYVSTTSPTSSISDKSCRFGINSTNINIFDSALTGMSTAEVKSAMSGVYLIYELATPTTEEASPYISPQRCDNWGTEEFITSQTNPIPIGHDTDYPISLKDKIESYPDLPSANGTYLLKMTNGVASWVAHS